MYAEIRSASEGAGIAQETRMRAMVKASGIGALASVIGGGPGATLGGLQSAFQKTGMAREAYRLVRNWVAAINKVVSQRIAAQPWMAGHYTDMPDVERRFGRLTSKGYDRTLIPLRIIKAYASDIEDNPEHDSLWVLDEPNAFQGKTEFIQMIVMNLLLTGEGYWIGGMAGGDEQEPKLELYAVPSSWIVPDHSKGLFGGFKLQIGFGEGVPLDKDTVGRIYFPDPSDIKGCLSPLMSCVSAVRIDDHILSSQLQSFERGIHPNLIVSIGKTIDADGKQTQRRPVLAGRQRTQIIRSIQHAWNQSVNAGMPAIIDGLIEDIKKLSNTPQEMDWKQSGEIVKARIMQSFGVNPLILGEVTPANKAQAVVAEASFATNTLNPIIEKISCEMSKFLSRFYEDGETLAVWLEQARARDDEMEFRQMQFARQQGDVDQDEFRGYIGLPAVEKKAEAPKRSPLLNNPQVLAAITALAAQVSAGALSHDNAVAMLVTTLQISEDDASAMLPDDPPEPLPMALPPAGPGQPPGTPPNGQQPPQGQGGTQGPPKPEDEPEAKPSEDEGDKGWEDQPRDEIGRWSDGGGGSSGSDSSGGGRSDSGSDGGESGGSEGDRGKPATDSIDKVKKGDPPNEASRSFIAEWTGDEGGPDDYVRLKKEGEAWVNGGKHEALDAIYKDTQQRLKDANITAVTAYRGVQLADDHPLHDAIKSGKVKEGDEVEIDGATFNSWSSSAGAAERFAEYGMGKSRIEKGVGVVFERVTAAEDIVTGKAIHKAEFVEHEEEIVATRPSSGAFRVRISKAFIA